MGNTKEPQDSSTCRTLKGLLTMISHHYRLYWYVERGATNIGQREYWWIDNLKSGIWRMQKNTLLTVGLTVSRPTQASVLQGYNHDSCLLIQSHIFIIQFVSCQNSDNHQVDKSISACYGHLTDFIDTLYKLELGELCIKLHWSKTKSLKNNYKFQRLTTKRRDDKTSKSNIWTEYVTPTANQLITTLQNLSLTCYCNILCITYGTWPRSGNRLRNKKLLHYSRPPRAQKTLRRLCILVSGN